MKVNVENLIHKDTQQDASKPTMAAAYPSLYCPRCGSYEIGLRMFLSNDAIWGCRDYQVLFALEFPSQFRF